MAGFILPTARIRDIVGRCHVGESNVAVIRYLRSRLAVGNPQWTKARRKAAYRAAIKAHLANRRQYAAIMSGRF